jgi:hypothetical protein
VTQLPDLDYDIGTWRDLATGVDPNWSDPENADGALDSAGDPGEPINTRLDGPNGLPWWDGLEDPFIVTGLTTTADPQYPDEAVGAQPIVGAYEGAYRTRGPVYAWGFEPSGGLNGDQALGRIMRFPANLPDRYDPNGVWNIDYRDELAATLDANDAPDISNATLSTDLLLWPREF